MKSRVWLVVAALAAVPTAAGADDGRPRGDAFNREVVAACSQAPEDGMDDAAGMALEDAIDCLVRWNVTTGRGPGQFDPNGATTRAQMASFLRRTLELAGATLTQPAASSWDDIGGVHEVAINLLTGAGVLTVDDDGMQQSGRTLFRSGEALDRATMARWMVRAHQALTGQPLAAEGAGDGPFAYDYFDDDDGHVDERFIDQIAHVGVTAGSGPRSYRPEATVTRGQMAAFLTRLLDVEVERGVTTVPAYAPQDHRVGKPSAANPPAESGAYAYTPRPADYHGSGPLRFDPCQTLHIRVNYDGAGPGTTVALDRALVKLTAATGTHIVVDGPTDESVADTNGERDYDGAPGLYPAYGGLPPTLVAFPAQWTHAPGAAAVANAAWWQDGTNGWRTSGAVLVNRAFAGRGEYYLEAMFLHELGHVLGLTHVEDPNQVMNSTGRSHERRTELGDGDRWGLWTLGAGSDCISAAS